MVAVKNYLSEVAKRFKALKPAQRATLLAALPALLIVAGLLGLPGGSEKPGPAPVPSSSAYDPYGYYLANNPDPNLVLSPKDAGIRASLGCQYPEAQINASPVDKALADAYRPTGICG